MPFLLQRKSCIVWQIFCHQQHFTSAKIVFVAKQPSINPSDWNWSPLANYICWLLLQTDQVLIESDSFGNLKVDATDKTNLKFVNEKICPLFLSEQFLFCFPAWKGPQCQKVSNITIHYVSIVN